MHYSDKQGVKKSRRWWQLLLLVVAIALFAGGAYLLLLVQSPNLPVGAIDQAQEQQYQEESTNYVKIDKLGLLVPFYSGDSAATLEKGAWWRYPDRGDPEKGGNFILSAHRFQLGMTPQQTRARSPFYHIEKLEVGDPIEVNYNGKPYMYTITKKYDVPRDATQIEAPSEEAKLTLYSCSLKGEAAGRVVIEAVPASQQPQR
jgi:sortase A